MGVAAVIAKLAFVGLIVAGIVSGELRRKGLAIFIGLGLFAWLGLPYLQRNADFVTPALAVIDVALVFVVYKGDIRIT